ncbi:MAG: Membrane protein [Frankiales bacterium]|nr:Membrane protein [Frankiales bacterium]
MQPSFVTPAVPATPRSMASLLGDALRRPGGRKALSLLSLVLFIAGVAMFAYPVGTDLYSRYQQGNLNSQFGGTQYTEKYSTHKIAVGDVLTKLVIPKIGLKVLVVEGTTPAALRAGAGHYPGTPLPGEAGNVGIAGHRTTFGRPFNHLDELGPGTEVLLQTPFKIYHYIAVAPFAGHSNPWVVSPTDYSVVQNAPGKHYLTLTTCNPKGSAAQRLVLRLELKPSLTQTVKLKGAKA